MRVVSALIFALLFHSSVQASSPVSAADPFVISHPFGPLRETRIGNIPHSPNLTLWGPIFHFMAVDLFQDVGTPVYAAHDGMLAFAHSNLKQGWTTTLSIRRDDGLLTYYMHVDPHAIPPHLAIPLEQGREVPVHQGELISALISTPGSTLHPHLHFGMANCSTRMSLNPLLYLGISDSISPKIHFIRVSNRVGIDDSEEREKVFSGPLDLSVEASDRWRGSSELYPPNRIEFEIRRLRFGKRSVLIESKVLFDASQIPFRQRIGKAIAQNCEIFSEFDHYASAHEASLYRFAPFAHRKPPYFIFGITQKPFLEISNDSYQALPWITPLSGPWRTDRCDPAGKFIYPNGKYEISVRASDISGNSSTKKRRIEIKNLKCGVE